MKQAILVILTASFLSGCTASMVNTVGNSTSQYAPTNERDLRGGTVKYLNQGATSIIKRRRENAYKQMFTYCGGPYRIATESSQDNGGVSVVSPGPGNLNTAYGLPQQYWYIDFQCEQLVQITH